MIGWVAGARAEALWLEGKPTPIANETEAAYQLALERRHPWYIGELASWRRRGGVDEQTPVEVAGPYGLELTGDRTGAAGLWTQLGAPYEAALALSEGEDEGSLLLALEKSRELGAKPLERMVSRRLRELGVRGVARGPRSSTRTNRSGLTAREVDVLCLLADGLRNAAIAERLFLSTRTVDHHVSAILRKLDVTSRGEAVAHAGRLGLLDDRQPET